MRKWLLALGVLSLLSCQKKDTSQIETKSLIPQNDYAMLIVESESCIYCKQLKKDLQKEELTRELQGMDVQSILYESNAKVRHILKGKETISTEEELARYLKVNSFPQVFFYNKEGKILLHLPGYQPPKNLACSIRFVKEEMYKEEKYMDYMKTKCI
ncbi:MAG: thioredoxin fold domain-containing protein [Aquificaceae bacterium]|nr:thioredoxin fold domain-containing protein [Aquificaceae bacterium]MCX8075776.1 thioredoxin fold domain-containing protein [Aquificaceae bacterium]